MTAAIGCETPPSESGDLQRRDLPCQKRAFSVKSISIESVILTIRDPLRVATDLGSPIGDGLLPQPALKVRFKLTGNTSCWLYRSSYHSIPHDIRKVIWHNACRCQLCSAARRENGKGTGLPTGNLNYLRSSPFTTWFYKTLLITIS
jgi:hypothetical protein